MFPGFPTPNDGICWKRNSFVQIMSIKRRDCPCSEFEPKRAVEPARKDPVTIRVERPPESGNLSAQIGEANMDGNQHDLRYQVKSGNLGRSLPNVEMAGSVEAERHTVQSEVERMAKLIACLTESLDEATVRLSVILRDGGVASTAERPARPGQIHEPQCQCQLAFRLGQCNESLEALLSLTTGLHRAIDL